MNVIEILGQALSVNIFLPELFCQLWHTCVDQLGRAGLSILSPIYAQVDTAGQIFQSYVDDVSGMSDSTVWTLVQMAVAIILTTIICGRTQGNLRDKMEREELITLLWIFALFVGFLLLSTPLPYLTFFGPSRTFVFTVSLVAIIVLPIRLAKLLQPVKPTAVSKRSVATGFYILIGLILVLHFFNS